MTQSTPVEDERAAYRVATLPPEYETTRTNQLFTRGYNRYIVDGEEQSGDLLTDLEWFGTAVFKEDIRANAAEKPFVDKPGILAVLATSSVICVKAHPKFEHAPPRKIQVLYDIHELYVNNLAPFLQEFGDGGLQQDIAEVLYAKGPGEDGPHPDRVCTGIKETPKFGDRSYLEIPMAAASRKCLVYAETETGGAGELLARVENNCLYVPVGDFDTKYRKYASHMFKRLLRVQEKNLPEDQVTWLTTNESAIAERIDRLIEMGHHERIWRDWNPGERTIRVLKGAIRNAPDEVVSLGEFYSAKELFEAVEAYDPEAGWKRDVCNRISSSRSLGNLLASQRDHRSLTIREHRNTNHYRVQESSRGVQPLDAEAIEDLFELPCMANMAERLREKKSVRKDLYSFARMVMQLPRYQDSDLETIVADLKDVFSRWPWYDEQVTDYQIRYEFLNTIRGGTPLPMNCDNDDMQRRCIGQEQCPYLIWGSLPFPDEMYDQLSGTEGDGNES